MPRAMARVILLATVPPWMFMVFFILGDMWRPVALDLRRGGDCAIVEQTPWGSTTRFQFGALRRAEAFKSTIWLRLMPGPDLSLSLARDQESSSRIAREINAFLADRKPMRFRVEKTDSFALFNGLACAVAGTMALAHLVLVGREVANTPD